MPPGLPSRTIGEDTLAALQGHDWPGNVRQLRNVIERLLILAPAGGAPIRADVLPNDVSEDAPSVAALGEGRRDHAAAAARCARGLRAGISAGPGDTLRRQHLAHPRLSSAWSVRRCTAS